MLGVGVGLVPTVAVGDGVSVGVGLAVGVGVTHSKVITTPLNMSVLV